VLSTDAHSDQYSNASSALTPPPTEPSRKAKGGHGEDLAADYLCVHGYRLLDRNVRLKRGEIDIIAQEDKTLVFVEVRTRQGQSQGLPEESITPRKQRTLRNLALEYLQAHDLNEALCRIDVVAIELGPNGLPTRISLIKNAVEGSH
jgi:putative endonuclease